MKRIPLVIILWIAAALTLKAQTPVDQPPVANAGQAQLVRPGTLVYILTAYLLFALLDGAGYKISETYITLLGQWGLIVMTAYFGGRTVEKVMEMRTRGKE